MAAYIWIWVNIGLIKGLLPDGIKPLSEPMLMSRQYVSMALPWEQFHKECPS